MVNGRQGEVQLTRRDGLRMLAAAGAGTLLVDGAQAAAAGALRIGAVPVTVRLTTVGPDLVRLTILPIIDGQPVNVPDEGTLVDGLPAPEVTIDRLDGERTVRCGTLAVTIAPTPLTIRVTGPDGRIIQRIRCDDSPAAFSFALGNGPLLGLGQGGPGFDRRGVFDAGRSGQGGYELATHGARVPVPWLIGTAGWGLFVHQPAGAFDLTGAEGRFAPHQPGFPLDIFVSAAREPAALMAAYARITGRPEMPPLWSLGYQQSHRTLGTPAEILAEARKFRDKKLPCDAMIYLGTGFCPNGWNTDNGEFTWNPAGFPDPPAAIGALHADGFKIVLHVVVEGKRMTGRVGDPCTAPPLPSGRLPNGKWPPDRQVSCYWPVHKPLVDLGVDGWWPDQGDGLDAPSRLARNRMYFEGQQLWRPNRRVYALHRNGFAGMQRFAAFLWSGDVESRWETLANHLPIAVNTALSGIPYWGTDIGGFVATDEYSGELFARWFQFAAFTPLFRSHGRDWRMHTPWGWSEGVRGVPETAKWHPAPEALKDDRVEPICRTYLELRYRLVPYLYTAVRNACETGMPIIRALWLHDPADPVAVARGTEYLFGPDLLVAPVVERGATTRRLYLPRGRWHDFWSGAVVDGGREVVRPVDLATTPLYVRAGAVLPLGPVKQHLGEQSDEPVLLRVYPGADGGGTLYEDDGDSFDHRSGAYRLTEFRWSDADRRLTLSCPHGGSAPRRFHVQLAGRDDHRAVDLADRSVVLDL